MFLEVWNDLHVINLRKSTFEQCKVLSTMLSKLLLCKCVSLYWLTRASSNQCPGRQGTLTLLMYILVYVNWKKVHVSMFWEWPFQWKNAMCIRPSLLGSYVELFTHKGLQLHRLGWKVGCCGCRGILKIRPQQRSAFLFTVLKSTLAYTAHL